MELNANGNTQPASDITEKCGRDKVELSLSTVVCLWAGTMCRVGQMLAACGAEHTCGNSASCGTVLESSMKYSISSMQRYFWYAISLKKRDRSFVLSYDTCPTGCVCVVEVVCGGMYVHTCSAPCQPIMRKLSGGVTERMQAADGMRQRWPTAGHEDISHTLYRPSSGDTARSGSDMVGSVLSATHNVFSTNFDIFVVTTQTQIETTL